MWKEAVAAAVDEAGLQALRAQLAGCTYEGSSGEAAADTLDVVFNTPGIGALLLGYTSVKVVENVFTNY